MGNNAKLAGELARTMAEEKNQDKMTIDSVIDMGGNGIKAVFYPPENYEIPEEHTHLFKRIERFCGLAKSIHENGHFCEKSKNCTFEFFEEYQDIEKQLQEAGYKIERTAVGTAPFRSRDGSDKPSAKGLELKEEILEKFGIDIKTLTGDDEAIYSALGYIAKNPDASGILIDTGGGSTEFTLIVNGKILATKSLPLGMQRLQALEDPDKFIQEELAKLPEIFQRDDLPLIISGGIYRNIGKAFRSIPQMDNNECEVTKSISEVFTLTSTLRHIFETMSQEQHKDIAKTFKFKTKRIPFLENAERLLRSITDLINPTEIKLSTTNLRDGVVFKKRNPAISTKIATTTITKAAKKPTRTLEPA